jgi:hypothetical protein
MGSPSPQSLAGYCLPRHKVPSLASRQTRDEGLKCVGRRGEQGDAVSVATWRAIPARPYLTAAPHAKQRVPPALAVAVAFRRHRRGSGVATRWHG